MILKTSTCMVVGMAFCMSFYGLATSYLKDALIGHSLFSSYVTIFFKNFIIALPLQLVVMGPLVRFLFIKFIKGNTEQSMTVPEISVE